MVSAAAVNYPGGLGGLFAQLSLVKHKYTGFLGDGKSQSQHMVLSATDSSIHNSVDYRMWTPEDSRSWKKDTSQNP